MAGTSNAEPARDEQKDDSRERGESIISQSPRTTVGSQVFVSVPGPVPVVRVKRRKSK